MSDCSFNTLDEFGHTQNCPLLNIRIIQAFHLCDLLDAHYIRPYICLRHSSRSEYTPVARTSGKHFVWNHELELELDSFEPIYLLILDKDDFNQDECLASLEFSPRLFEKWNHKTEVWLRLEAPRESISTCFSPEDLAIPVSNQLIGESDDLCPLIHLEIEYFSPEVLGKTSVEFARHKTLMIKKEVFTAYQVKLKKMDGDQWEASVRYSDISELREELIRLYPEIAEIPFPKKTYFNWLGKICSGCSKFDQRLISRRKRSLENFLNAVLEMGIENEKLFKILRMV